MEGTDADTAAIRKDLDACFGLACFIPCDKDSSKGCRTKVTIVIKKWGSLSEDEQQGFHYVNMVDDDGLPSNAYIGKPNGNVPGAGCTWRKNANPMTYCHEVLHLCGLPDRYCSRLFDPVTLLSSVELICDPPPDPDNGKCCTPTIDHTRCSTPCEGHDNDLMAQHVPLSCDNIMDVLQRANFNKCPPECCGSGLTFRKDDAIFIAPSYFHFGDKSFKLDAYGITIGYSKGSSSALNLTIDAGVYQNSDKNNNYSQKNTFITVTGGASYTSKVGDAKSKLSVTGHALGGILNWISKFTAGNTSSKSGKISVNANVGAALNLRLNNKISLRLLQADFMPTFFAKTIQTNYRLSAGVDINLSR